MFGEPAPTQGDIHFRLFRIPIRIHPLFWLVALILGASNPGLPELLIWVAAVLVSITIHELGHALIIAAYGFHPWIVLYGMGGLTCHDPSEKYSSKANTPLGQISISFAGPAAGFLLAAVLAIVLYQTGYVHKVAFIPPIRVVLYWNEATLAAELANDIFYICIFWGLINLLPIYPLDGGQIVREILLYMNPREGIRQSLMLSIFTAGLVAVFGLVKMQDWFIGLFFIYMAYESFMALQAYSRGGRW